MLQLVLRHGGISGDNIEAFINGSINTGIISVGGTGYSYVHVGGIVGIFTGGVLSNCSNYGKVTNNGTLGVSTEWAETGGICGLLRQSRKSNKLF